MEKEDFYKIFKSIPKAELHLHLEAVLSRRSVQKLLARSKNIDEDIAYEEAKTIFNYSNLEGFKKAYSKIHSLYSSVADFDLLFSDLKDYLLRNGISYAEVFAAPSAYVGDGWDFNQIIDSYRKNVQKIKMETGINVRILIDLSRTNGKESAEKNLQLLLAYRTPEVLGVALCGSEEKGPARLFNRIFAKARANNLETVAHAGEDCTSQSIWDTIDWLKATRIGQATSAMTDQKLIAELAAKKIPVEISPTSNVFNGKFVKSYETHNARQLFKKGVLLTIGSDYPLFLNTELIDEYWHAYSQMGFKLSELHKIIRNSFDLSFLSNLEKSVFMTTVDSQWRDAQLPM